MYRIENAVFGIIVAVFGILALVAFFTLAVLLTDPARADDYYAQPSGIPGQLWITPGPPVIYDNSGAGNAVGTGLSAFGNAFALGAMIGQQQQAAEAAARAAARAAEQQALNADVAIAVAELDAWLGTFSDDTAPTQAQFDAWATGWCARHPSAREAGIQAQAMGSRDPALMICAPRVMARREARDPFRGWTTQPPQQ